MSKEASAAWQDVKAMLECRGGNRYHYCPNCDNSLYDVWPAIERARAADAQQIAALRAENERLHGLLDFQQGNYEDVAGDDLLTPEQMAEMQASFNAFVAARQERSARLADYDRLEAQLTALQAENEKLFKELAYEVDQRRQVENLMQLEVSVAVVRCSGGKHHWLESADAEGDTCDCGEWYRFSDRIESSR